MIDLEQLREKLREYHKNLDAELKDLSYSDGHNYLLSKGFSPNRINCERENPSRPYSWSISTDFYSSDLNTMITFFTSVYSPNRPSKSDIHNGFWNVGFYRITNRGECKV